MQRLANIQLDFRDALIWGDMRRIAPLLAGGHDPVKRLAVHQRNYRTSLVDALLVKFPATGWLVGTPFLTEAAEHFVRKLPPRAPCIAEYGEAFPEFLSLLPFAERLPYLTEFANLEWHIGQVSIAVDAAPIGSEQFSINAGGLADMRLTLQPGLRHLGAQWPVDELMRLYLTETAPDQFRLSPADVWIEVRGARGEFQFARLQEPEFIFRESVSRGLSIGDAAEYTLDIDPGFDPGHALASLIASGLVTAIGAQQ